MLFPLSQSSAVSGRTLSTLISSPVQFVKLEGQLPPALRPFIYWAPLCRLWLPRGHRLASDSVKPQLVSDNYQAEAGRVARIHRPFVANWIRPCAGSDREMNSSPQRAMWLADLERGGRLRMAGRSTWLMCLTQHLSHTQPDADVSVGFQLWCCVSMGVKYSWHASRRLPGVKNPKCSLSQLYSVIVYATGSSFGF